MRKCGIPIVPGSLSAIKDKDEAIKVAKRISYPVIIKAASGGGGKGMRVCHNDISLASGLMILPRLRPRRISAMPMCILRNILRGRGILR